MGTIDTSKMKIYIDGKCINEKFKPLHILQGDKEILKYISKVKWLKTSEVI